MPPNDQTPQSEPAVQALSQPAPPAPARKTKWPYVLVLLLVAILAGAGVWYWQQSRVNDLTASVDNLESSLAARQDEVADTTEAESTIPEEEAVEVSQPGGMKELVTAQFRQDDRDSQVSLDCMVLPGELDEIWVQYGDTPNVTKRTESLSSGLAIGEPGEYSAYPLKLPNSEIEPGKQYFYQCAGIMDGQTVYAGLATFFSKK